MINNPLMQLGKLGQSVWLDFIRRDLISGGGYRRMMIDDGLSGVTSNPAIFEKIIVAGQDYKKDIHDMALRGKGAEEIYEALSQGDIRMAADEFRPIYDSTDGKDGYISLEVNPHLAHDTDGTICEARRLWALLDRPNVFIKVPATDEGLSAVRQLISEGININITLLFGLHRYRQAAKAYISGLEDRLSQGKSLKNVASVASFFLSRIDTMVDPILEITAVQGRSKAGIAQQLMGQAAVSCAKAAYQIFKEIFHSEHFKELESHDARPQRLLWASTGVKNPGFKDVKYIDALIGPDTVSTIPVETMDAYRDHGDPKARLEVDVERVHWVMEQLPHMGINMDRIALKLEDEGIEKFNMPYDNLMQLLMKTPDDAPETESGRSGNFSDR
jgi:transaldolase